MTHTHLNRAARAASALLLAAACAQVPPRSALPARAALSPAAAEAAAPRPGAPPPVGTAPRAAPELPIQPRSDVQLGALSQDLQRQAQVGRRTLMALWTPEPYWRATLEESGTPEPMIDSLMAALRPYLLFFALDGTSPVADRMQFDSEAAMRTRIRLIDAQGRALAPLEPDRVSRDVRQLLELLTPVFAKLAGPLGSNIHAFVFARSEAGGEGIGDPLAPGLLKLDLGAHAFEWELPLPSLVRERICPVDHRAFSGTYRFCPHHGVELVNP